MLRNLMIRNVVLIEELELSFCNGLCVLTGETGAGKSILLDALGLAIGARADVSLVRSGASEASVVALFDLQPNHKVFSVLSEHGISFEFKQILLRRIVKADGYSRAFINDQLVSVGLLKEISGLLIEIHGQFENQRLLKSSEHRVFLDSYGDYSVLTSKVLSNFERWKAISVEKKELEKNLEKTRLDNEYLTYSFNEIKSVCPIDGEESKLATERRMMINGEEISSVIKGVLDEIERSNGIDERLQGVARLIGKVEGKAEGSLGNVALALERALNEVSEATNILQGVFSNFKVESVKLEHIEERLFLLRALARKHNVSVDQLSDLMGKLKLQLESVNKHTVRFEELEKKEEEAKIEYEAFAGKLTILRAKAAKRLDKDINVELQKLEMGKSQFVTQLQERDRGYWKGDGAEDIIFLVSTNPGQPLGPLGKIASGGEMARFMLSVKVVLSNLNPISSIIFDEVDSGVGGAVASAVGDRLMKLAQTSQVLVVTHSPQVAAKGMNHMRVFKGISFGKNIDQNEETVTKIKTLNLVEREEEIARMLSDHTVTDEARAAANSLLSRSRK